jgi:hypothetical protein
MFLDNDSGFKRMEHIERTTSVASNIEVWQLALTFMDKYQKAFEALAEGENSSDLSDSSPSCSE